MDFNTLDQLKNLFWIDPLRLGTLTAFQQRKFILQKFKNGLKFRKPLKLLNSWNHLRFKRTHLTYWFEKKFKELNSSLPKDILQGK